MLLRWGGKGMSNSNLSLTGREEMTPESQQEYFPITKEELYRVKNDCIHPELDACSEICEHFHRTGDVPCTFSVDVLIDEILSRPHTKAPEIDLRVACCAICPCRVPGCEGECKEYLNQKEHDAQVAHAATLAENKRVLDKLKVRVDTVAPDEGIHLGWVLLSEVNACIKSLRIP
jgi:hypothetical protein